VIELIKRLYQIAKRVLKVIFGILPDISPTSQTEAHRDVDGISNKNRLSEYQRVYSDRSLQRGKRAYMLILLEQKGIPFLLKVKRIIIDIVRAIKPQHQLSTVISLVK
jgi:hypothetical protein